MLGTSRWWRSASGSIWAPALLATAGTCKASHYGSSTINLWHRLLLHHVIPDQCTDRGGSTVFRDSIEGRKKHYREAKPEHYLVSGLGLPVSAAKSIRFPWS
jgi:hypothetical protein